VFKRQVPVFWFAVILIFVVIAYSVSFVRQGQHFKEMDSFMHKGDRFTVDDGAKLEARIRQLEEGCHRCDK